MPQAFINETLLTPITTTASHTTIGATAQATGTTSSAQDAAAQAALLSARHKDQCVDTTVLSIQLTAKKHTRYVKALFYLNDKLVKTVKGSKLYVSKKTKVRKMRVQKFRNLPAGPFVLKVLIRSSTKRLYRLRAVYYHCTPPHKIAKKVAIK